MPFFKTTDGCKLNYDESGSGKPLLLIHGWSQTAAMFKYQVSGLSNQYRVIAIDLRGHGESEKPICGYRISRLTKDMNEFINYLELKEVNLLGWSMGSAIIWCYLDLFGSEYLSKLILVDHIPYFLHEPDMSKEEIDESGALFDIKELMKLRSQLRTDRKKIISRIIEGLVTSKIKPNIKNWIIKENLKMPAEQAAKLFFNLSVLDLRDVITNIKIPTLIIGAKKTHWKAQLWLHKLIKGSKIEIFEEEEGGGHYMFLENPQKFNKIVRDFIG